VKREEARVTDDLKRQLVDRLKQAGAYDVRIADPHVGFEHALSGQHPLEVWDQCRSVVVFAVACPPQGNNTYLGPYAPWQGERYIGPVPEWIQSEDHAMDRLTRLFIASITLKGMAFLSDRGCDVSFRRPQHKLSAFEAGIGVYGRSGLILHPVLGNRLRLGVILTDIALAPDGRLEGFAPCEDCDLCIKACPARAFDPAKSYPHSFSRQKCTSKRAEIASRALYCHNCYAVCPAGEIEDEELMAIEKAESSFRARA
jgi:epoxyqueuosine reductase QueG